MSCLSCRVKKYPFILASLLIAYSLSCSVAAQDKLLMPEISNYKIKLALANLPVTVGWSIKPKDFSAGISHKGSNQASLRISPNIIQSLPFSLGSFNPPENSVERKPNILKAYISKDEIQPLGFYIKETGTFDTLKWEQSIKKKYKNSLIKTVAPGVKHISLIRYTNNGAINLNILEVNSGANQNISVEPALAKENLHGTKRITSMAKENLAIAGINASFFKPDTGTPLGTLIINEELVTGPIYERVTLGITDNSYKMAKVSLRGKITNEKGISADIDNANQPRMLCAHTIIYTSRWGKIAPLTPKYGIQIAVDDNVITEVSKDRLTIPDGGYVIVGPESKLGKLKLNEKVEIYMSTTPDWSDVKHAVSGGPYLIKDGQVYVDAKEQKFGSITGRNPRTAVGFTNDNTLIMVTVDGRQQGSVGVSLYELANLMKEFGCSNAMNLDGGSSTQMVVNGVVVNHPLYKGGSYVSTGLIVKINDKKIQG